MKIEDMKQWERYQKRLKKTMHAQFEPTLHGYAARGSECHSFYFQANESKLGGGSVGSSAAVSNRLYKNSIP
jgi:hypothetical protein